jgi:hypothetical protein
MKLQIRFQLITENGTYAVVEYNDSNINNPVNNAQLFLNKLKAEGIKAFNAEEKKNE